ncbi:MAG: trypsin-like peptidase domain-containing protein [Desulfuromonadales bacterium]|nr:trypsin-like peptidase domain-containing protein [Desulfuromonadales bacterium]
MMERYISALMVLVLLSGVNSASLAATNGADQAKLPVPSTNAQKLYGSGRNDLLQLRILLRNGRAQSSVGSGFLIDTGNLVVTNYHVVSQLALEPETYVGEYVDTSGRRGLMELLAVDVLHDLAVVRIDRAGTGFFRIPEQLPELRQGQYLYSLGNPLDLGFAISEGAYNGVIHRGFYDQLMFTGPINAGMSGGPNITADGRVAGVNVSKRLDGELVSFLVPIRHARELLKKAAVVRKQPKSFNETVAQQLLAHQTLMVDHLLAAPLTSKSLGKYQVPVRESDQMRCWGQTSDKPDKPYTVEQIKCSMESSLFVSGEMQTGHMAIRHEYTRGTRLDALRFSNLVAKSFKREQFGSHKDRRLTGPVCTEQFVTNGKLPMRAVLCVRAYRKFAGLYDFALVTNTSDENLVNLQSRLDIKGVSYENGLRVSRLFLESIGRVKKP